MDLKNFDTTTLAKIWDTLNSWEWAYELGKKPEDWDSLPIHIKDSNERTKYNIINPIMNKISNCIGHKECLRWHHLFNLHSTNEQFEQWWETNHIGRR